MATNANIRDITRKTCAIVYFAEPNGVPPAVLPRRVHYQVTIDPDLKSREGFIRFGNHPGDEITGWQPIDTIVIAEILGEVQADGKTVVALDSEMNAQTAIREAA